MIHVEIFSRKDWDLTKIGFCGMMNNMSIWKYICMCMLLLAFVLLIIWICMKTSSHENDQKVETETHIATYRYLKVIKFEGHTYILLRNTWNCSGDQFLHDPNCKCMKKNKEIDHE